MAPKPFNVHVTSVEFEFDFTLDQNSIGKQLFDQVAKNIGLREIWFFGLRYIDSKNVTCWLKLDKKILSQDIQRDNKQVVQFEFLVRFFPEDVSEELIEDITQRLFYRQVKNLILSDAIYCPAETCILLASYAMQAKHKDYNETKHQPGVLANERLLPDRVREQFHFSNDEWEKRIINWWKEHKGLTREEAMLEYLKIAQDLDMYGVDYFDIQNKKGTHLYLGVDALGINIYDIQDKLTPKIGFPWSEIRNITFNGKKFLIKPMDRNSPDFVFIAERLRINRQILSLSRGNHELYMRRRTADSMELRQIKAQAEAKKLAIIEHRERTKSEIELRRQVEQEREVLHKKIQELERSAQIIRQALEDQNDTNKQLEDKRRQVEETESRLQREREEEERKQEKTMQRMQYEQQEREKMVQEIEKTRLLAEENAQEAQRKEHEARQIEEDLRETQMRVLQAQKQHNNNNHNTESYEDDQNPVGDADTDEDDNSIDHNEKELDTHEYVSHHEEERTPIISRDQNRKQKLEEERRNLQQRQQKADTPEDKIYRENTIDRGIDKYKTLKKIRQGTVKRRIDEFEAM
ncbi:unnamed protein product [Rotaria sp. Silwood1]|nr:unnamed protein product [Rotaria sp. Silwood1]